MSTILAGFLLERGRVERLLVRHPEFALFAFLANSEDFSPQFVEVAWKTADWACAAVLQYDYRVTSEEAWLDLIQGATLPEQATPVRDLPRLVGLINEQIAKGRSNSFQRRELAALVELATAGTYRPMDLMAGPDQQITPRTETRKPRVEKVPTFTDSVHGPIQLTEGEIALLESPYLQRLRRCSVSSTANLVFPTMTHSLFEHALGSVATMTKVVSRLLEDDLSKRRIESLTQCSSQAVLNIARVAALVHDIAHIPFNIVDLVDDKLALSTTKRERLETEWRSRLVQHSLLTPVLNSYLSTVAPTLTASDLSDVLSGTNRRFGWLTDLLFGTLNVDRIDYIMRDALYTGMHLGFDLDQLLHSLSFVETPNESNLGIGVKSTKGGASALEHYALALLVLHERVYLHRQVRVFESHWDRFCSAVVPDISSEDDLLALDSGVLLERAKGLSASNRDARAVVRRDPFGYHWQSSMFLYDTFRDRLQSGLTDLLRQEHSDAMLDTEVFTIWSAGWFSNTAQAIPPFSSDSLNAIRVFSYAPLDAQIALLVKSS